jgi:hypothetical protein
LSATDIAEARVGELLFHSLVVPHPQMPGAAENCRRNGAQASWCGHLAEPALLHETRAGCGRRIAGVKADQLFEVRQHETKSPARTKIREDVSDGDAELVQSHMLEHVRTVDRFC